MLARQPRDEQSSADIVRKIGDDVPATVKDRRQTDRQRVALDHFKLTRVRLRKFGQRRQAATVSLDGDDACPSVDQGSGQPTRSRSHLVDAFTAQVAWHTGDLVEQLRVEEKILTQRFGRGETMTRNDFA